jgi:hypothetical protein
MNRDGSGNVDVPWRARQNDALTDNMSRGTITVARGWGHDGGWTRANATPGAIGQT